MARAITENTENTLFYGDNFDILREYFIDECVLGPWGILKRELYEMLMARMTLTKVSCMPARKREIIKKVVQEEYFMATFVEVQTQHPHPDSLLAKVVSGTPLLNNKDQGLIAEVPSQRWNRETFSWSPVIAKMACIDNGNEALKGVMPIANAPYLARLRVPTAYTPAKKLRGGDGRITWRVNGSEDFWMGDDALETKKAESLPVGFSPERFPDHRFQRFIAAFQVELLVRAGHGKRDASGKLMEGGQGEFNIFLSIGLPPEEVDRNGATPEAREALKYIFNKPFEVVRVDEQGQETTWHLCFVEFVPYGQTFGSFCAWYYTLEGTPIATNIDRHITLDIGGGQFHICEVEIVPRSGESRPKLRMSAEQIGEGTILIARGVSEAIRQQYRTIQLSDAEAQHVLLNRMISVGGRRQPVNDIVSQVIASRADNLNSLIVKYLQYGQSFLMFTGGGSVLLHDTLLHLVNTHRKADSFYFVPPEIAPFLNAIGGLVLAQASAQRAISRREAQQAILRREAQQAISHHDTQQAAAAAGER
ncbi:hypothetical protein [Ktedonobacter sp. SOSP1-52]|uniref:hypothetical protein n=1 Tax=Ktedonobacter sp. SOSP1-52 TaxID=2778366 RepID=UPI0019151CC6|nr:hypothetical protein [Ktedonobacter sp. SOSP1-52]